LDGDRDVADLPVHLPVDAAIPIVKVRLVKAVGRWEGIEMKRRGSLLAPESALLRVGLKGNQPHLVAEMCPMRLDSAKGAGVDNAERLRLEGPRRPVCRWRLGRSIAQLAMYAFP